MCSRFKHISRQHRQAGFTLIEVICALVLLGVLGTGLIVGFSYFTSAQLALRQNYAQNQKVQLAMTRLLYEIKNASSVTASANTISYTFSSAKQIYQSNGTLVLLSGGNAHVLTDNVTGFTATYANNLLAITLTTSLANGASTQTVLYVHA
jgi:prepilin-type N-terminal cleavage/methylation domain-containing protein